MLDLERGTHIARAKKRLALKAEIKKLRILAYDRSLAEDLRWMIEQTQKNKTQVQRDAFEQLKKLNLLDGRETAAVFAPQRSAAGFAFRSLRTAVISTSSTAGATLEAPGLVSYPPWL